MIRYVSCVTEYFDKFQTYFGVNMPNCLTHTVTVTQKLKQAQKLYILFR